MVKVAPDRHLLLLLSACGSSAAIPDAPCAKPVVLLERMGGAYDHGVVDDATRNLSLLVDQPRTLPPWPNDQWNSLAACIKTALAPFPIDVTDVDPGSAPHFELVFTTAYWAGDVGTTGIVPDSCRPGHQIGFLFGAALPTYTRACQVAMIGFAEMAANLSPVDNCADLLNNDMDCAPMRAFIDHEEPCTTGACRCGGTTENTFRALETALPACP